MDKADKSSRRRVHVDVQLDEDELQAEKDLEAGAYAPVADFKARNKELQKSAKRSLTKKPVTIRMMNMTIDQLKFMSEQQGIPYQTLVNSVLHKYITGQLKERD